MSPICADARTSPLSLSRKVVHSAGFFPTFPEAVAERVVSLISRVMHYWVYIQFDACFSVSRLRCLSEELISWYARNSW